MDESSPLPPIPPAAPPPLAPPYTAPYPATFTQIAPARASLATAIRGPVLLIALGTLFTLDYSGGVSFWRTWPVLLIAFGFLKLIEHMGNRTA